MNTQVLIDYGFENMEETLHRFIDDEEFYFSILSDMLADPGFDLLVTQLKNNENAAAFETAHMLKGIIANCGVTPMTKQIVQVVEPLRDGGGNCAQLIGYADKIIKIRDELKNIIASAQ